MEHEGRVATVAYWLLFFFFLLIVLVTFCFLGHFGLTFRLHLCLMLRLRLTLCFVLLRDVEVVHIRLIRGSLPYPSRSPSTGVGIQDKNMLPCDDFSRIEAKRRKKYRKC